MIKFIDRTPDAETGSLDTVSSLVELSDHLSDDIPLTLEREPSDIRQWLNSDVEILPHPDIEGTYWIKDWEDETTAFNILTTYASKVIKRRIK